MGMAAEEDGEVVLFEAREGLIADFLGDGVEGFVGGALEQVLHFLARDLAFGLADEEVEGVEVREFLEQDDLLGNVGERPQSYL